MTQPIHHLFVVFLIAVFPFWDRRESDRLRRDPTSANRIRSYCVTIIWLWAAAALLFATTPFERLVSPPRALWLESLRTSGSRWPIVVGLLIGLVAPMVGGALSAKYRASQLKSLRAIDFFLPRSPRERGWFAAVSISAGICEEIIFRGFLIQYLATLPLGLGATGAIVGSAVGFGIDHGYQGWKGMVATTLLAFGLTFVFVASQTIWIPMIFHALIDLRVLFFVRPRDFTDPRSPLARAVPTDAEPSAPESVTLGPSDAGYRAVIDRQFNRRFRGAPLRVEQVHTAEQAAAAVERAVREGLRLAATSGGHCLEGFVSDPEIEVLIDVSPMKRIYHDPARQAIAVEAGATVGETIRTLDHLWGTVIPLGEYPAIGMGGHVAGGAFGFLCRELGLAADYLVAVEVVTVDETGHARIVVATSAPNDPRRELWWAHTGGGAGTFGLATRFWFRDPAAAGVEPTALLPRAPSSITTVKVEWRWPDFDPTSFQRLIRNFGTWVEHNSDPASPNRTLWALLSLHRAELGSITLRGLCSDESTAVHQIDQLLAAISNGIGAPSQRENARMSWLDFALDPFPDLFAGPPSGVSVKVKDALLIRALTDEQIAIVHHHLTRSDTRVPGGMFGLATYGGRINAVAPTATASVQRRAIFDSACNVGWIDPADGPESLSWVRSFYQDLFAGTGGVPVPGDAYDGTFINHPDTDLADPELNRSGVPWHTLYFGANYERLGEIKRRWDPGDVFRHRLSVRG